MIYQQPLNQPIDLIGDNDCDCSLLEPLALDAPMSSSSSDLLSGFMMEDMFCSPSKSKQQRRRVSFQEHRTEIKVQSFACLGEAERGNLWYRQGEIERFRSNARHACRELRENPMAYSLDVTRGLELRTSLDRQWRKHLALSCIVKAQVRYPHIDPYHLASIAKRCTELPRLEALAQGSRDFCAVYYPNMSMKTSVAECQPSSKLSSVTETALQFQGLSRRLQKRASPKLDYYNKEGPLAKRHCPMMSPGEQFQACSMIEQAS